MQGAVLKTTISHSLSPSSLSHSLSSLFLSVPFCPSPSTSFSFLLPPPLSSSLFLCHLEEEIKRADAQRQTLIPSTPADALLPAPFPPPPALFRRCTTRFQTPIHAIPLDTLAMAEGTTPSRETLLLREAWDGAVRMGGVGGRVIWVGAGGRRVWKLFSTRSYCTNCT